MGHGGSQIHPSTDVTKRCNWPCVDLVILTRPPAPTVVKTSSRLLSCFNGAITRLSIMDAGVVGLRDEGKWCGRGGGSCGGWGGKALVAITPIGTEWRWDARHEMRESTERRKNCVRFFCPHRPFSPSGKNTAAFTFDNMEMCREILF